MSEVRAHYPRNYLVSYLDKVYVAAEEDKHVIHLVPPAQFMNEWMDGWMNEKIVFIFMNKWIVTKNRKILQMNEFMKSMIDNSKNFWNI